MIVFDVYIFVDLVKRGVLTLTLVGEIWRYRNDCVLPSLAMTFLRWADVVTNKYQRHR